MCKDYFSKFYYSRVSTLKEHLDSQLPYLEIHKNVFKDTLSIYFSLFRNILATTQDKNMAF